VLDLVLELVIDDEMTSITIT